VIDPKLKDMLESDKFKEEDLKKYVESMSKEEVEKVLQTPIFDRMRQENSIQAFNDSEQLSNTNTWGSDGEEEEEGEGSGRTHTWDYWQNYLKDLGSGVPMEDDAEVPTTFKEVNKQSLNE